MATAFKLNEMMDGEEFPQRLPSKRQQPGRSYLRPRPALVTTKPLAPKPSMKLAPRRGRLELMEFWTVKRIDNSRLVRHIEPMKMRSLYKTAALGGVVALFFMLYIFQHFRCIDLSFQLEDLKGRQEQAAGLNSELRLEMSALRDPHRIDVIAQHELGLKRPDAMQVREYGAVDGAQVATAQFAKTNRIP